MLLATKGEVCWGGNWCYWAIKACGGWPNPAGIGGLWIPGPGGNFTLIDNLLIWLILSCSA